MNILTDPETARSFLVQMSIGRILLMVGTLWWLTFTLAGREKIKLIASTACLVIIVSNLLNVIIAVGYLKVQPW